VNFFYFSSVICAISKNFIEIWTRVGFFIWILGFRRFSKEIPLSGSAVSHVRTILEEEMNDYELSSG
jgi:hypothetical protein